MAIHVRTPQGFTVDVESVEDAAALVELLAGAPTPRAEAAARPSRRKPLAETLGAAIPGLGPRPKSTRVRAKPGVRELEFLRVVAAAGPGGITTPDLVAKLGWKSGRSLSGIEAMVVKRLNGSPIDTSQVVHSQRKRKGSVWRPLKNIEAAVATLERLNTTKKRRGRCL